MDFLATIPSRGQNATNWQAPLVFFYSGQRLPNYSYKALRHAVSIWGQQVVLICDTPATRVPSGVLVVDYAQWFQPSLLEQVIAKNGIDPNFRSGLWTSSLKRFFVLHQFLELLNLEKVAHAELDTLVFASHKDLFTPDLPEPGLLVPWNPPQLAIGSLVLVNGRKSLDRLIDFATELDGFSNEMELLTAFLADSTEVAFGLPTVDALMYPQAESVFTENLLTADQVGWRFDAARLGQWILGVDPKNTPSLWSKNHYHDPCVIQLKVGHDPDRKGLLAWPLGNANPSRIANIHVHSKRIGHMTGPLRRELVMTLANLPFASVIGLNSPRLKKRWATGMRRLKNKLYGLAKLLGGKE